LFNVNGYQEERKPKWPHYLTQIIDTPSLPCWKETQEANWNLQKKTPFKDEGFIGSIKAHQNPMVGLLGQS